MLVQDTEAVMNELFGLRVVSSPLCEQPVPVRKHKKRRNQTEAYHRRVQKKWVKRFGIKTEHVAFMINPRIVGLWGAPMLAMHTNDIAMLRNIGANV